MNGHQALSFGLWLADLIVKSSLVLLAAWLVTLALRRGSASTRHLVWLAGFCSIILLPALMRVVPANPVAVVREVAVKPSVTPSLPRSAMDEQIRPSDLEASAMAREAAPVEIPPVKETKPGKAHDRSLLGSAAASIWLAGVLVVGVQSVWGLLWVKSLRRKSSESTTHLGCSVDREQLSQQIGLKRKWELRICAGPKPPSAMTWGLMKPIVLIPKVSASWSSERLEAVLLHELAHVRRNDSLSQLIAAASCALYWFNPAVWLCARAMRAEAEIAADDTVLRLGVKPSVYAQELVRIAAELGNRRQPFSPIGVPVMKQSKIESRVNAILDPSARQRRGITRIEALVTVLVTSAIVLPFSSLRAAAEPQPSPSVSAGVPSEPFALYSQVSADKPQQTDPSQKQQENQRKAAAEKAEADKRFQASKQEFAKQKALAEAKKRALISQDSLMRLNGLDKQKLNQAIEQLHIAQQKIDKLLQEKQKANAAYKLIEKDGDAVKQLQRMMALRDQGYVTEADVDSVKAKLELAEGKAREQELLKQLAEQQHAWASKSEANHKLHDERMLQEELMAALAAAQQSQNKAQEDYAKTLKALQSVNADRKLKPPAGDKSVAALIQQALLTQQKTFEKSVKALMAARQVADALKQQQNSQRVKQENEQSELAKTNERMAKAKLRAAMHSNLAATRHSQLAVAKAQFEFAKKDMARVEKLWKAGVSTGSARDKAEADLKIAEAQLKEAQAMVDSLSKKQ